MKIYRHEHRLNALGGESSSLSPLSGEQIGRKFAKIAIQSLRNEQLPKMRRFFKDASLRRFEKIDIQELSQELATRLASS